MILILALSLVIPATGIANNSETPSIHKSILKNLKQTNHKVGRVNLKQVKPLCIKQKEKDQLDYTIGVTFLTQKNNMVSPGFGANFSF